MKKKFITQEETSSWKNIKSINKITDEIKKNKDLIKKAEAWKLPWYHVVKPKEWDKYLRSNPDNKKKNNLDPKRKA